MSYRKLTPAEQSRVDGIKAATAALLKLFNTLPSSRENSLAITNLEQAGMWAVKGVTMDRTPPTTALPTMLTSAEVIDLINTAKK